MASQLHWSTIVEENVNGKWCFFSQQSWLTGRVGKADEVPLSDAAYLALCRGLGHTTNELRVKHLNGKPDHRNVATFTYA